MVKGRMGLTQREINEAIESGENAKYCLRLARKKLRSALRWSRVDLFSDSMIVNTIKYGKVFKASTNMQVAQNYLRTFQKRVKDADVYYEFYDSIDEYAKDADVFCDCVMHELEVHDNIADMLAQVERVLPKLEEALARVYKCTPQSE